MTSDLESPPFLPQVRMLHDQDRTDQIYARAIELAYGPSRRANNVERVPNVLYWGAIFAAFA